MLRGAAVPDGSGQQLWLDNLRCVGTEQRLVDCPSNDFGVHNCGHNEDVGVTCRLFVPGE